MKERIKLLRKTLGLTLEKFGSRLEVSKSAIGNIENGTRNINDRMVKSICSEFNVNEQWLRYGTGEMFKQYDKESSFMKFAEEIMKDEDDSFRRRFVSAVMNFSEREWNLLHDAIELCASINDKNIETSSSSNESIEDLEEEYKKSRLKNAQKTEPSASNITEGTDRKAN